MARNSSINLDVRPLSDGYSIAGGTTSRTLQLDGGNVRFVSQASTNALTLPNSAATNLIGENYYTAAGTILQGSGAGTTSALALGTAAQQLRVNAGATALEYFTPTSTAYWTQSTETTTSHTFVSGESVAANNAALVTFTLPATAAIGDHFRIQGVGAGGWRLAQNSGQSVRLGSVVNTSGASGQVNSTNQYDDIEILCIVANTTFKIVGVQGNPDLV